MFDVDQIVRVPASSGGYRVWQITGIHLGATRQESVITLKTLDLEPAYPPELRVPERMLELITK